jgi:hypothetical protein
MKLAAQYSKFRSWPRLCENAKFENPNGKLPPIYSILRLENGFQWSVQVLTRPVMQRYPTCKKFKIVFTQPRPLAVTTHELTTSSAMGRSRNKSPWIRLVPLMSGKQNLSAA